MVTDLEELRRLGKSKEAENRDFRRYVAAHHYRRDPFHIIAGEIQHQIDCTTCANCCRCSVVALDVAEIAAIAGYLGADPDLAARQYTKPDPDEHSQRILKSGRGGCVFLDGNLCAIYEVRPKACRDFPHVALGHRSLGGRPASLARWASLCPIIYNAIESYKHALGYHVSARA